MRKSLLVGATALFLSFGVVGAHAMPPTDQAAFASLNQQVQEVFAGAGMIEGRAAFVSDNSDVTGSVEHRGVEPTFRQNIATMTRDFVLLALTGLVLGLGAVGAKALWVLDDSESTPSGLPRRFRQ